MKKLGPCTKKREFLMNNLGFCMNNFLLFMKKLGPLIRNVG